VPLAATVAAAAGVRVRKRRRAEEVSALREGMQQWRHTGSVAGAPPAESESDEGCEPGRRTYLVSIAKGNELSGSGDGCGR